MQTKKNNIIYVTASNNCFKRETRPGPRATITHRRDRPLVFASWTETCLNPAGAGWMERARRDAETDRGGQAGGNELLLCTRFHSCVCCGLKLGTEAALIQCPPSLPFLSSLPPPPRSPPRVSSEEVNKTS